MQHPTPGDSESSEAKFWDRYIKLVHNHGVNSPFDRWYVIRAEQYIEAFSDKKLRHHSHIELEQFLSGIGCNNRLKDWQMHQAADAIRLLLCDLVGLEWACQFNWDSWKASVRSLGSNHATVARDFSQRSVELDHSFDSKEAVATSLATIRVAFKLPLDDLVIAIRRLHYSIKTEQTYESWVARFLGFSKVNDLT